DVLVVLRARRRWSFRREGPNGSALLVEIRGLRLLSGDVHHPTATTTLLRLLLALLRLLELSLVLLLTLCLLGWNLRCLLSVLSQCQLLLLLPQQQTLPPIVTLLPTMETTCALLPATQTAPLAAPADVAAAETAGNAVCLLERTTSLASRSGQHHLSPKKKKKTHSFDCPKGAGALDLMDPTLCLVWIIVTIEQRRPKMKKLLQKRRAVLRGLERSSLPLLHDVWRGRGWKPLLLLLCSLLQWNALLQRNTRLLELLRLSINRHVLGCNRLIWLGVLMLHQLLNLHASVWRHVLSLVGTEGPGIGVVTPAAPIWSPTAPTSVQPSSLTEATRQQSAATTIGSDNLRQDQFPPLAEQVTPRMSFTKALRRKVKVTNQTPMGTTSASLEWPLVDIHCDSSDSSSTESFVNLLVVCQVLTVPGFEPVDPVDFSKVHANWVGAHGTDRSRLASRSEGIQTKSSVHRSSSTSSPRHRD
ncbi:hypothetical protein Taro_044089, partial [Colocasia esculenta]|nr:hypothetical protein [Colocasia esculenta]